MNKKEYIDAINEIEISEEKKNETLNKIKNKQTTKTHKKILPIATLAIACAVIIAIILPTHTLAPITEINYKEVEKSGELPKVENFENLYAMLKKNANKDRTYGFLGATNGAITDMVVEEKSVDSNAQSINSTADSSRTSDYSKTNIQVEGVDEADIVKTDGKYIYYLANNKLTITDASSMQLLSSIKINENNYYGSSEMFLKDNKVVLVYTFGRYTEENREVRDDYYYSSYKTFTVAKIYNIQDRTNPKEERTVELEGSYIDSRMIGNNLYLISNKYLNSWICRDRNIDELKEDDFKTTYTDTAITGILPGGCVVDFDDVYYIPEFEDTSYLNIAALDITKDNPVNVESYLGAGNQIYASNDNLYVTRTKGDYSRVLNIYKQETEIYKFALKDGACVFKKTGTVPGSVLNQFSMDEKDGYFRIATTDNSNWMNSEQDNNLYVLNENLEVVGKVEGLAKGERIYSVRFMGNRAYMVTFVQTDPLFVIDLSNPTNPTVLGELKIPGYSKYLHPYDDTHLIGIGEDTKIVNYGYGDVVTTDGMKMALFDVTDPKSPKEMYVVKIGEKGTYSEILNNHKALLFSKEKNLIAFPVSITENDYNVTFQGAVVYGLSLEKGFELRGKITNSATDYDRYYYKNAVERIIYIGDTLYTLSNNLIKATAIETMETLGSVEIK